METHHLSETGTTLHVRHVCPGAVTRGAGEGLAPTSSVSGGPYSPSYPGTTPPAEHPACFFAQLSVLPPLVPLAGLSSLQSKDGLLCSLPTR